MRRFYCELCLNVIANFVDNRLFSAVVPIKCGVKVCDKGVKMIFWDKSVTIPTGAR
jgi:hypothetical protein